MAMHSTSLLGLPVASLDVWQLTDTTERSIHTSPDAAKPASRKLLFRDGCLVGAVLVGECVHREAGILHNVIRTRQAFTLTRARLEAGPLSWGHILRDNRFAGRSDRPANDQIPFR